MNAHNAAQDLANAQAKLARARQQLRRLQQAAMEGCYDEVALDDAVITYRQARLDARAARLAWSETRDTGLEQPVEQPTWGFGSCSPGNSGSNHTCRGRP